MNRTKRGGSRPLGKMSMNRARTSDSAAVLAKSHDAYPVRVKSHDGYVECNSSILADLSDVVLGQENLPLHLKFEIFGKRLALNYGYSSTRGVEVHGVLVGTREQSRVRIVDFRQMDAAPASDASVLTEDWQSAFAELMARIRWDPKLTGLEPVGWFRAHPKASLNLFRRDIEIFKQFFPEAWQVGMVLQPGKASATGRFFLREPDQPIDSAASAQEFVVQRDSEHPRVFVQPASQPAAVAERRGAGLRRARRKIPAWAGSALGVSAFAAVVLWTLWTPDRPAAGPRAERPATPDLNQEATKEAAALWKKWQEEAIAKQQAASALPELPPPPANEDALAASANETVSPLSAKEGEPPAPAKTEPEAGQSERESSRKGAGNPRSGSNAERSAKSARPPQTLAPAARKPETAAVSPPRLTSPPNATPANRPAPPTTQIPAAPLSAANLQPPEIRETASSQTLVPLPKPPAAQPVPSPAPPPVAPPSSQAVAPPPKPSIAPAAPPAAPASGRLIWTGRLRKNETIVIEGGTASIGSASGSLPGKPVQLNVLTGNLTKDGIVIYTQHPRGPGKSTELPGPENGWNKTAYEWEPDRAADVEVVEAPGPGNGWKRLVLRAKNPRDSMIVVEWKAQP